MVQVFRMMASLALLLGLGGSVLGLLLYLAALTGL
jgi:hypothetical protein